MSTDREYLRTHPWISFKLDLRQAPARLWARLGQAVAHCEQIAGAALPPAAAQDLQKVYLAKGVQATTAIEGNTLTEEQIEERIEGRLHLPPSQAYLGQEVDNIIQACTGITEEILDGRPFLLTPELIAEFNRRVLKGLDDHLEEGVVPAEIPRHTVVVGGYRGAPRRDCAFLLDRLCCWLNEADGRPLFGDARTDKVATAVLHAVVAHLYIAWIHPFGDGNGRTARLVEFMLLAGAGAPLMCAHLLSNHYNLTRAEYYRQLDRSSRANGGRGDPIRFVEYALGGLVDGLKEQCRRIEEVQLAIAWDALVYEYREDRKSSPALNRRLQVARNLTVEDPVPRSRIRRLTPPLAELYAGKTDKTVTRDLNWLKGEGLIVRQQGGYRARITLMQRFRPPRAPNRGKGAPPERAS